MPDVRERLASMCGQVIVTIALEEHVLGPRRSLVSIWLAFADGGMSLRTAQEGWGLAVEATRPTPTDLGQYGRLEVQDARGSEELAPGAISAAWVVVSPLSPVPVGVKWTVANLPPVLVYGYDDELIVGRTAAPELGALTCEELCGTP